MQPERVSFAVGSSAWSTDVSALSAVLGDPAVIQEGQWAQFDFNGVRVSVGTDDELPSLALMVKVHDTSAAADALRAAKWEVQAPVRGAHEIRVLAKTAAGLQVILYEPAG